MQLNEFFDYKNQLMKELCCNEAIVKLVTDKDNSDVPNHTLAYSQIYPFEFVPETVDNGQTIICFDVDVAEVINKTFYVPVVYVWVFTHKSKMRLSTGGIRTDKIAAEIDKVLNGSRYYGLGELNLKSVGRFSPIADYQGRVLTYYAKDFNRLNTKQPPSNRKQLSGI
ncbi:MAG: hypothetical protein IKI94_01565 [Ruminococcus sp.]|nr:hypothetical protein [Ruminococcus sp.]